MTVKQLIELLKTFPQDYKVYALHSKWDYGDEDFDIEWEEMNPDYAIQVDEAHHSVFIGDI